MSDYDSIFSRFDALTRREIEYNMSKVDDKQKYKDFIVDHYYRFPEPKDLNRIIFYPEVYAKEIDNIHERISYAKYNQVVRRGMRCKFCGSDNTMFKDEQRGGGDEYIPTRVTCYNCGKNYLV